MRTMIREVYDAFRAAGVPEDAASAAAQAVEEARESDRMRAIEQAIGGVREKMADMRGDMRLMRWMIGFNLALSAAILLKLIT